MAPLALKQAKAVHDQVHDNVHEPRPYPAFDVDVVVDVDGFFTCLRLGCSV